MFVNRTEHRVQRYKGWGYRLIKSWPFFAWALMLLVALYLANTQPQFGHMRGAVEALVEPIAPLETSRLKSVAVTVGQRVKAGDVIATMDTSLIDARGAIEEAQALEAEGTISSYQQSVLKFVRDYENTIKDAQFALETQQLYLKRDTAVLNELQKEMARREDLKKRGFASEQDLSDLRPQIASLYHAVAAYPAMIAIESNRLEAAIQGRIDMRAMILDGTPPDTDILDTIRQNKQQRTLIFANAAERRRLQRETYTLRATRDGMVARVFHQPGDVVSAGDPIVRLVAETSDTIVGFLPEIHLSMLTVGQKALAWRLTGIGPRVIATVESIEPEVQQLPGRISPIRGQPLRGRRVILRMEPGHGFIPGETMEIQSTETLWSALSLRWSKLFRPATDLNSSKKISE